MNCWVVNIEDHKRIFDGRDEPEYTLSRTGYEAEDCKQR